MKFSTKDFFSKCDQIRSFLQIWSHLLKKNLMEIFFFCAVAAEVNIQWDVLSFVFYPYSTVSLKNFVLEDWKRGPNSVMCLGPSKHLPVQGHQ